jgi:hypothetical protein
MTEEKPVTLSYTERIELGSAAKLIGQGNYVPVKQGREAVLRVVEAECGQIARSVVQDLHSSLQAAEGDGELLHARVAHARELLSKAEEEAVEGPRNASWLRIAIWSLFAIACFAAEFVFTWTALCFVLNVQRFTVLGVLLGLAPPSGLAVLEIFLARLFEEPWQRLRRASASGKKLAMNMAMASLLIALALGNGLMIFHLAKAREEAAKLQRILSDPDSAGDSGIDQEAIDRAIVLVSILVSVDGAVFLLLGLAEGSVLAFRSRQQRRITERRTRCERLEAAEAAAKAKAAALREDWETVAEKAALAAERYRAHCHFLLAEKAAADRERPIEELVDRALRHRIPA